MGIYDILIRYSDRNPIVTGADGKSVCCLEERIISTRSTAFLPLPEANHDILSRDSYRNVSTGFTEPIVAGEQFFGFRQVLLVGVPS